MKIISFKKIGKEQVYNLSMRGKNHNYILEQKIISANSHAICYSITGYITAYLKCNYPAAFFAAYLKSKTDSNSLKKDEDIAMAKDECKRMGIKIVPPDINKSGSGYEVLDEKTIVMGLKAVKGMGGKAVDEIIINQPYNSFLDFVYKTEARVVNKSKIEVLAKAGCFDSLKVSRKEIYENGKSIREKLATFLKKKEKEGCVVDMVLEEFPMKLSSEDWEKKDKLQYEKEVLGELVSGTLSDLYPGFFTKMATPIEKLKILPDRENIISEFLVKSILREFKMKSGKYIGQMMIKYRVEDVYGNETELTVWPSEYENAKRKMLPGVPVRAACQVSEFNGQKTLMLRTIEKIYSR